MPSAVEDLLTLYEKTGGRCYHCGKHIVWKNYGSVRSRGAWEVDRSNPRARRGTNQFSNLVPSCITCNREKGVQTSRQFGSLRLRAEDLSKGRRVKKLGKNLTPNDFIRITPADRAFYRKEIRAFR
jgi:5-methylcytosine-specific restriction endonuclease McrA